MKDFATSLIVSPPSPANSGTSLTVQTGHGTRFPTPPFYATIHPALLMPDLDNAEKVQVTAIVGDAFTIVRALSPTTAKTVAIGYRISNTLFADDIASLNTVDSVNGEIGTVVLDTDDIAAGATNKYVTSAEKTKLSNLSGTNTGDQDLSGYVPTTRTVNGHALSSNVTVSKSDVGLANVDNTSDANKPVSMATQTALDAKATTTALTAHTSDVANPHSVTKTQVGLGNADNTSDANKPVSTATTTALSGKEATITATTTADYYRGDKTFQTLNKTAVGLGNVDNTSDASKPVSTATQTALNLKANTSSLATVATTGAYSDLTGKPTLGTAAAQNSTAFATAAQGTKADSAVQSVVAGTNVTVDSTDPQNPVVSSTGGGGSSTWGGITGTLSAQTDLQGVLDTKIDTVNTDGFLTVDPFDPAQPGVLNIAFTGADIATFNASKLWNTDIDASLASQVAEGYTLTYSVASGWQAAAPTSSGISEELAIAYAIAL